MHAIWKYSLTLASAALGEWSDLFIMLHCLLVAAMRYHHSSFPDKKLPVSRRAFHDGGLQVGVGADCEN